MLRFHHDITAPTPEPIVERTATVLPFREWRHCAAGVFCGVVPGSCVLGARDVQPPRARAAVHGRRLGAAPGAYLPDGAPRRGLALVGRGGRRAHARGYARWRLVRGLLQQAAGRRRPPAAPPVSYQEPLERAKGEKRAVRPSPPMQVGYIGVRVPPWRCVCGTVLGPDPIAKNQRRVCERRPRRWGVRRKYPERPGSSRTDRGVENGDRWRGLLTAPPGPHRAVKPCAERRRSRPPGRFGTNPGIPDIYIARSFRKTASQGPRTGPIDRAVSPQISRTSGTPEWTPTKNNSNCGQAQGRPNRRV